MDATAANNAMVDRFIAEGALWSQRLVAAFRATPRHWFVKRIFQFERRNQQWQETVLHLPTPEEIDLIYTDRAWITHVKRDAAGKNHPVSSSSQPSLMAQMLEEMQLEPGQRVLEIGAGTGYNAALIAYVVGHGLVTSIDVDLDVVAEAWAHLRHVSERQVQVRQADGRSGWPDDAPFNRIVVTASSVDIEPAWITQLAPDGMISVPLELAPGLAFVLRARLEDGVLRGQLTRPAYFLSLRDEAFEPQNTAEIEFPKTQHATRAPWADWLESKPTRMRWFQLLQSLAFWAWLHGLNLRHKTDAGGQPCFAVNLPQNDKWCCWSTQKWEYDDETIRETSEQLWNSFLANGAPWPMEYRVSIALAGETKAYTSPHFRKKGANCRQLWELLTIRQRSPW